MRSVIIIGGGISGLAAAYFLEQQARERSLALDITLLEASSRLGGVVQSERIEVPAGGESFLCEAGPDSLLTTKPAAIELCRALGLSEQLIPSNDALRKTYVLHHGALRTLPDGLMFVVPTRVAPMFASPLLSLAGKLRLLLAPLLAPGPLAEGADISVDEYIAQRFGQEVSDRLAEPLLNAVYGSDVRRMSTRAVFPQLLAMERKHGSLWKAFAKQLAANGKAGAPHATQHSPASATGSGADAPKQPSTVFVTLRDGLGQLPARVAGALRTTRVLLGEQVLSVERDVSPGAAGASNAARGYRVRSSSGERLCDAVVVAAPAPVAARLLAPLDASASQMLAGIVYHSVAIAALGFRNAPPAARASEWGRRGFGFVVPRGEGRETIACTWVHNKFSHRAPQGATLLRSFFGGARNERIDQLSDAAVWEAARSELRDIMGLGEMGRGEGSGAEPDFHRVFRWADCMPQYGVGHLDMLDRLQARLAALPGLQLAGNGFRGVGIPDCVESARQAATRIIAQDAK